VVERELERDKAVVDPCGQIRVGREASRRDVGRWDAELVFSEGLLAWGF
jgi:hypothetical protein